MNAAEMKAKCLAIARRSIEIASRGGDRFGHGIIAKAIHDAIAAIPVEADPRDAAERSVCDEILEIMRIYREQEASFYGVDTPGGLEHMGDVWRLLYRWDEELRAALAASEPKPEPASKP